MYTFKCFDCTILNLKIQMKSDTIYIYIYVATGITRGDQNLIFKKYLN